MRSWKHGDLQIVQSADEGTEGAHLPQEKKVEVPQLWSRQDAEARLSIRAERLIGDGVAIFESVPAGARWWIGDSPLP
jgi:hypothetical protein